MLDEEPPARLDQAEADEYCRTQAAMVKSRLVFTAALRDPKVANLDILAEQADPLAWLEKNIKVDFNLSPEIMRISLEGHQPEEQQVLVDAIVKAYLEEVLNRERNQAQNRVDQLMGFAKKYEDRVKSNRRTMRSLQGQVEAADNEELALRRQLARKELDALHGERLQAEAELRKLRLERAALRDRAEAPVPEGEVEKVLREDPELSRLREAAARLEARIEELALKTANPEKSPAYAEAQTQLKEAKKGLAARRDKLRPAVMARIEERLRAREREAAGQLDQRIQLLDKLSAQLAVEIARLLRESRGIVQGHLDVEEIRQDISRMEEMAGKMKSQAERLTIELEAPPRAYRLQEATVRQ
jgi:hypothetical protein